MRAALVPSAHTVSGSSGCPCLMKWTCREVSRDKLLLAARSRPGCNHTSRVRLCPLARPRVCAREVLEHGVPVRDRSYPVRRRADRMRAPLEDLSYTIGKFDVALARAACRLAAGHRPRRRSGLGVAWNGNVKTRLHQRCPCIH